MPGYLFMRSRNFRHLRILEDRKEVKPLWTPEFQIARCTVDDLLDIKNWLYEETCQKAANDELHAPIWTKGSIVKVATGPFMGMVGVVLEQKDEIITVFTDGFLGKLKISPLLLERVAPI